MLNTFLLGALYFIVIVLANTAGAISGMGGGVIIKPILDFINQSPITAINFYSSFAVFIMSIVSTYRQKKNGIKVDFSIVSFLAVGSIIGGVLGDYTFSILLSFVNSEDIANVVQIVLTLLSLVLSLIYSHPKYNLINSNLKIFWLVISGFVLGWLSTLLGIGGGPINVALLITFFSLPIKDATVYSIIIIFFSQIAKIVSVLPKFGYLGINFMILPFVGLAAIVGGYVGAKMSKKINGKTVLLIYRSIVSAVIIINLTNLINIFLKI